MFHRHSQCQFQQAFAFAQCLPHCFSYTRQIEIRHKAVHFLLQRYSQQPLETLAMSLHG